MRVQTPETGIQRFEGSSMRALLRQVRDQLGADALIHREQREAGRLVLYAGPAQSIADGVLGSLQRSLLHDADRIDSPYVARLRKLGFGSAVIDQLPAPLDRRESVIDALLRRVALAEQLPTAGIVRFAGPRGSGVTTQVLRFLCAHIAAGKDPRRILIASSDADGLGRGEPLRRAAALWGLRHLEGPVEDGALVLRHAHPETLLVVDESCDDPSTLQPLEDDDPLTAQSWFWVIPAHWRSAVASDWLQAARQTLPRGSRVQALVTHGDRVPGCGTWLSLLMTEKLPFAWLQIGPDATALARCWSRDRLRALLEQQIDQSRAATTFKAGERALEQ